MAEAADVAAPRPSDATRRRIIDAAAACILAQGWHMTSLTDIAARAGLSRPTVYARGGDRDAIAAALRTHEQDRFAAHLDDVLTSAHDPRDAVVDGVVTTVAYARGHALLQHMLAREPEVVLPWLTLDAGPLLAQMVAVLAPHVERAVADSGLEPADPEVIAEWAARLALSLVLTPSTAVPLDDAARLRRFVGDLFQLGLVARGA
jgi:AcrR family transcriptional regulator